jgi:hypothetical protein
VLRLIDALIAAGAGRITRPPCPRCGRVITLSKILDGARVCRNCLARSRAEACSRCGIHREPATRDEHGRPLCPHCMSTDPSNLETCLGCARRRPVSIRTPEGPLCPSCRPARVMSCSICGRSAACEISKATGLPWCTACQQRWARCARCGEVRPIRGGTSAPFCATCTRPEASFWRSCPACGQQRQLRSRSCARCSLRARLSELLGGDTGEVRAELQALHENLATGQRPDTVLGWLNKNKASAVLRELGAGERALTHSALDELPASKPIEHLRAILVATSTLPPRDEHLARLNAGSRSRSLATASSRSCTATPSGTCCAGFAAATTAGMPRTARPSRCSSTSGPRSCCWTGCPPASSPSAPPGKVISSGG